MPASDEALQSLRTFDVASGREKTSSFLRGCLKNPRLGYRLRLFMRFLQRNSIADKPLITKYRL